MQIVKVTTHKHHHCSTSVVYITWVAVIIITIIFIRSNNKAVAASTHRNILHREHRHQAASGHLRPLELLFLKQHPLQAALMFLVLFLNKCHLHLHQITPLHKHLLQKYWWSRVEMDLKSSHQVCHHRVHCLSPNPLEETTLPIIYSFGLCELTHGRVFSVIRTKYIKYFDKEWQCVT